MAFFKNGNANSAITAVEFTPMPEGNTMFVHLKEGTDAEALKQQLTKELGQNIISSSEMGKHTVLVTSGDKSQAEILAGLKERGDNLAAPEVQKSKFQPWKIRAFTSFTGQPMQIISSWMGKKLDVATFGFSFLNLTASTINYIFGAEQKSDPHHLRYIKEEINKRLTPYLDHGEKLPDPADKLAPLSHDPKPPQTGWQGFRQHVRQHSVLISEIGLRSIANISLVFPFLKDKVKDGKTVKSVSHWGDAAKTLATGTKAIADKPAYKAIMEAHPENRFQAALGILKNPDNFTYKAGEFWLAGKLINLTAKVPDPYDPDQPAPHTLKAAINTWRDKYAFKVAAIAEGLGALTITYDRFANRKIFIPESWKFIPKHIPDLPIVPKEFPQLDFLPKFFKPKNAGMPLRGAPMREVLKEAEHALDAAGKVYQKAPKEMAAVPDFIGGVGGLLFTLGYAVRFFAPFGVREVNMEEVNAHVVNGLSRVPQEKLPQALADSAAFLTDHFKDKHLEFSKVYNKLSTDLYRHYDITLPSSDGNARLAQAADNAPTAGKTFSRPELRKSSTLPDRPHSFIDRAALEQEASIGM